MEDGGLDGGRVALLERGWNDGYVEEDVGMIEGMDGDG